MSEREKSYETLRLGETLGPIEHHVTAEMVRRYAEATGDNHAWHTGEKSPFGEAIAHPAMVTIFSTRLLGRSGYERPSGGIHAKQEYAFLAPLRVGSTVQTSGTVTGKYERNGRKYIVYDAVSLDDAGVEVARCKVTTIVPE